MGRKSSVLVTGANGLIGKHLLPKLAVDYNVHAIVREEKKSFLRGVNYHVIDLSSDWNSGALPKNIEIIIHLAQSRMYRDFPDSAIDVFKVNIESTATLLNYAREIGAKHFVYASSGGIYGKGSVAFSENSPIVSLGNLGYYLNSKLCGEMLAQSYASFMQLSVLRFFFVYGPGQNPSMLVPRLVSSVSNGKPIRLFGKEGIKINPIFVDDAVRAIEKALQTKNSSVFNIAGPNIYSLREVAELIGSVIGKKPIFSLSDPDESDLVADITAMKKNLYSPKWTLVDGVKRILEEL